MTIKNVVVPVEIEYLQEAAKKRGISRTKLVQVVMEKVVKDELVLAIRDDSTSNCVMSRASQGIAAFGNKNAD